MLRRTSTFLAVRLKQWIPDPFVFAILLIAHLVSLLTGQQLRGRRMS